MTTIILEPYQPESFHPVWEFEAVELNDVAFGYRIHWNARQERYSIDVYTPDRSRGMYGIKMVPNFPLGFKHTGRRPDGGYLMLVDQAGDGSDPCGYEDLGHRFLLMWVDSADMTAVAASENWTITLP